MSTIDYNEDLRSILCERIEKQVGQTIGTPRDFDYLSMRIFDATKTQMSATTLKRLWGYIEKDTDNIPRISTLNILARFVGYTDWAAFCKWSSVNGATESDFILNNHIYVSSLRPNCRIQLMWHPDRIVTIQVEGHDLFSVVESVGSKLSAGDTFHIGQIIEGEPLYLRCLVHEGGAPTNYVCGKVGGVRFNIL